MKIAYVIGRNRATKAPLICKKPIYMPLFLIFLVFPFLELMVFAAVGDEIGWIKALALCFITAIIGSFLVRQQGLQTLFSLRASLDRGKMPLNELFDGFCLVAAGTLLITPGFITDTLGFLLLTPPVRDALRGWIKAHTLWAASGTYEDFQGKRGASRASRLDPGVIEGEYERVDSDQPER